MINGLSYIVLFCRDTEKSKEWYENIGFELLRGFDEKYWFKFGEGELMLHPTEHKEHSGDAQFHASVTDVDSFFDHVKEAGFQPTDYQYNMKVIEQPVVRPWGIKEFGLKDPDGYVWAFTQKE